MNKDLEFGVEERVIPRECVSIFAPLDLFLT